MNTKRAWARPLPWFHVRLRSAVRSWGIEEFSLPNSFRALRTHGAGTAQLREAYSCVIPSVHAHRGALLCLVNPTLALPFELHPVLQVPATRVSAHSFTVSAFHLGGCCSRVGRIGGFLSADCSGSGGGSCDGAWSEADGHTFNGSQLWGAQCRGASDLR